MVRFEKQDRSPAFSLLALECDSVHFARKLGVRNIPEEFENGIQVVEGIDTTIAGNDLIGTFSGVFLENSTGTKVLSNDISRSRDSGILIFGRNHADVKVVGNNISGGPWGIFIVDTTYRGSTDRCKTVGSPAGLCSTPTLSCNER